MPKCDFNKVALLCVALKSHSGMGVLLYIFCIFSEHLFLRSPLDAYLCKELLKTKNFEAFQFIIEICKL